MADNTTFEQYNLDNPDHIQDGGPDTTYRLAVLALLNSFVVSPNVLQTSKSIIVGAGRGQITLDSNRGLELSDITLTESVQNDPDDSAAGVKVARINLPTGGIHSLNVYGSRESTGTDYSIAWDANGSARYRFPIHGFFISGGQDSTQVEIRRRSDSPVINFPNFESPPSTCTVGDITVASGKLYICSATNTWTVVGTQT